MNNDANESETYGDYSVDDEDQRQPEDTLEDGGDPLDDLNTPPDNYSAGQRFGNTPAEEERGETFAQRLRQEEPEYGDRTSTTRTGRPRRPPCTRSTTRLNAH